MKTVLKIPHFLENIEQTENLENKILISRKQVVDRYQKEKKITVDVLKDGSGDYTEITLTRITVFTKLVSGQTVVNIFWIK